jgi:long-chain acyl-CoA synthetase
VFLESLLTQDPLILQAMVVGDGRSHLGALIFVNQDLVKAELARGTASDVQTLIRTRIDACLANVSTYEQVRKFVLLPRPLSIEAGELTPKLSLRRQEITAHFAAEIESMYRSGAC